MALEFSQFRNFHKKLEKLEKRQQFFEECAKELAARLLAKVIKRTPVGQYQNSSGKKGGTLRRGWTSKTENEAMSGGPKTDAIAYVNSLTVTKSGGIYKIEIINPVHYAPYVEYGHRTANLKGWVDGKYMLTISEKELNAQAPQIIMNKLQKYLEECFNG